MTTFNNYNKSLCVQWLNHHFDYRGTAKFCYSNDDLDVSKIWNPDNFSAFREAWIAGYKAHKAYTTPKYEYFPGTHILKTY